MKQIHAAAIQLDADMCQNFPHKLAVGWSGGADSTALLVLLMDAGFEVQAWHIDHGWHEASQRNATVLAEQAEQMGVVFHSFRLEKPLHNLEAQARAGRYAAFSELASNTGCQHLVLGHHADDQAETICMRLLQGAGVAGCQGIRAYRKHGSLHLFRPLLHHTRRQIEAFLQQRSMAWLDDPSNQDTALWRNKIRHQLFPAMQSHGVNPRPLFMRWQIQAQRVQEDIEIRAIAVRIERFEDEGVRCVMDGQAWGMQLVPVRAYLLQKMMGLLFEDGRVFGRRHILAIEQWWAHGGNGWLNLSRCCLYKEGQHLQLVQVAASLRDSDVEK